MHPSTSPAVNAANATDDDFLPDPPTPIDFHVLPKSNLVPTAHFNPFQMTKMPMPMMMTMPMLPTTLPPTCYHHPILDIVTT